MPDAPRTESRVSRHATDSTVFNDCRPAEVMSLNKCVVGDQYSSRVNGKMWPEGRMHAVAASMAVFSINTEAHVSTGFIAELPRACVHAERSHGGWSGLVHPSCTPRIGWRSLPCTASQAPSPAYRKGATAKRANSFRNVLRSLIVRDLLYTFRLAHKRQAYSLCCGPSTRLPDAGSTANVAWQ